MTQIDVEFQDVPMSAGPDGWIYGDSDKIVTDLSFTAVIEAVDRDNWIVEDILFWEIGCTRGHVIHYGIDKEGELFRQLKYWLETDQKAVEKITDYVSLEILPSGRVVGGDPGSTHCDAGARI